MCVEGQRSLGMCGVDAGEPVYYTLKSTPLGPITNDAYL